MTTRTDAYQLLQAVKQGGRARLVKSTLPVISGVLLRRTNAHIEILSTNLEDFEAGSCPAFGDEETWEIVLPSSEWGKFAALPILDWLRALNPQKPKRKNGEWQCDVLTLEVLPRVQTLKVQCGRTTAHFKGIDAQEFPLILREKIDEKLSDERVKPERKKRKRPLSEEVLARATEEAWQKVLKQTRRMSAENEMEHWKTWLPLLEDHRADIEKRLAHLGEVAENCRRQAAEWQAERIKDQDAEHLEKLERLEWLDYMREALRDSFESTLRRDKRREMREPVKAWPFHAYDDEDTLIYQTSYDWLEAGFVWNDRLIIGRGKSSMYRPHYFDTILGYEATTKQVEYAKFLDRMWSEAREDQWVNLEEINNPSGEEPTLCRPSNTETVEVNQYEH